MPPITDLKLLNDPSGSELWSLEAVLGAEAKLAQGTKIVLTRKSKGVWDCSVYGNTQILKVFSPEKCQIVEVTQNLQEKDSKRSLASKDAQTNNELYLVFATLSGYKTSLEAVIFEGKIPVVKKERLDEKIIMDIEWNSIPEVSDFKIFGNKRDFSEWFMVATLSGAGENKLLKGTQYVFHRDSKGSYSCAFYWADKQKLRDVNTAPCTKKSGLLMLPSGFVSSERLAKDGAYLSGRELLLWMKKGSLDYCVEKIELAVQENKTPVEIEQVGNMCSSKHYSITVYQNTKSDLWEIVATFNKPDRVDLAGVQIRLIRNKEHNWRCHYYLGNKKYLAYYVPEECKKSFSNYTVPVVSETVDKLHTNSKDGRKQNRI